MKVFVIVINCIFIATIYVQPTITDENTNSTTSTTTFSTTTTVSSTTTTISNSLSSTTTETTISISLSSTTTETPTSNSLSSTTTAITSSSTLSTPAPGESPPTRSAQLGMGLGITFIGILLISEIVYFNFCYRGNLRSGSYLP